MRFQELDCFLTDERTRCGRSGSPVVRRRLNDGASTPSWQLMSGMHCTRMSLCARDQTRDESSGLNCAWYADVLPVLTRVD